jgi:rhodanese-related sulfurtransferase
MKRLAIIAAMLVPVYNGAAQVQSEAYNLMLKTLLSHAVPELSVDQLAAIKKDVILLDARAENEFRVSHIENARFIGEDLTANQNWMNIPRHKKIVVYCSVGYRSEKLAEKLKEAGFTDVSNLYGGIFEWVNQGYQVVDMKGAFTPRIHAYSRTWGVWLNKGTKVYDE